MRLNQAPAPGGGGPDLALDQDRIGAVGSGTGRLHPLQADGEYRRHR
ncbi:hypothetical protein ACFVJ8_03455 [Streptomyces yangpuensis]